MIRQEQQCARFDTRMKVNFPVPDVFVQNVYVRPPTNVCSLMLICSHCFPKNIANPSWQRWIWTILSQKTYLLFWSLSAFWCTFYCLHHSHVWNEKLITDVLLYNTSTKHVFWSLNAYWYTFYCLYHSHVWNEKLLTDVLQICCNTSDCSKHVKALGCLVWVGACS
jgi:hypothetical protein